MVKGELREGEVEEWEVREGEKKLGNDVENDLGMDVERVGMDMEMHRKGEK